MKRRLASDPKRRSLRLLPSGPDRVGECLVRRQPPGPLYQGRNGAKQGREAALLVQTDHFELTRRLGRQDDCYGRAGAGLTLQLQPAAMQLREVFGERQSQPDALIFAGQAAVDLAETLQRLGDLVGRHTDTGIGDLDGDIVATAMPGNANSRSE